MWMDLETIILSEVSQKNKYILMRINLEKWYRWIFLQSGNRDTDVENKYMNIKGEGRGGMSWEIGFDVYTLLILCIK